jgi:hypothetical protein
MGLLCCARRTLVLVAIGLFLCAALGGVLWRASHRRITDRELLLEAVEAWRLAGSPFPGPNSQILERQAAQGYYDDAIKTARLWKLDGEQHWLFVEVTKIRAENGDIAGAKNMIEQLAALDAKNFELGLDLRRDASRRIALLQAFWGDLQGALETAAGRVDSDEVLAEFASRQIEQGDFDGALATAEQLKPTSADNVFYGVGSALQERGDQKGARALASHMSNRKLAAEFMELSKWTLWPSNDVRILRRDNSPCGLALDAGTTRQFAEADRLLEQNKCMGTAVTWVAIQQYAVDPAGAERVLRRSPNKEDLRFGMAQLAIAAANKGDVDEALRMNGVAEQVGGKDFVGAAHEIARAWTIRDGPMTVLQWARARPNTGQRTWALIGMAEALGHGRH